MKPKWILLSFVLIIGALSGCTSITKPAELTAEEITSVWLETVPPKSDSPKYTNDPETIGEIVNYINGLNLRLRTDSDEAIDGMETSITLTYSNGTVREFLHGGNKYFSDLDNVYVMEYEQASQMDGIYNKMQTAPLVKGAVEQVTAGDNGRMNVLLNVDLAIRASR